MFQFQLVNALKYILRKFRSANLYNKRKTSIGERRFDLTGPPANRKVDEISQQIVSFLATLHMHLPAVELEM